VEYLLVDILKSGSMFGAAAVVVLSVFASRLAYSLYKGERSKIDRAIKVAVEDQKLLNKEIEGLIAMSSDNKQAISILLSKYEQLKEDQAGLQARLTVLDNRVSELGKDMHTGFSDIKTLLIHLFGQRRKDD
jgi:FtsZ-binding cell division protein ZapB